MACDALLFLGAAKTEEEALAKVDEAITSGEAYKRFLV